MTTASLPFRPASPLAGWLTRLIVEAAREIHAAGRAKARFAEAIEEAFGRLPIQEWEADRWMRGRKLRLLKMEAPFFRAGTGKSGSLSLFVRNEAGLNVGLRREAITQMATYVSLITDYGYGRDQTRYEHRWMDVAVVRPAGAWLYAENKAAERVLLKLCARLEKEFAEGLPPVTAENEGDDAVMKATHILTQRPRYFWAVCPTARQAYEVAYRSNGFHLARIADVPDAVFTPPDPDPLGF